MKTERVAAGLEMRGTRQRDERRAQGCIVSFGGGGVVMMCMKLWRRLISICREVTIDHLSLNVVFIFLEIMRFLPSAIREYIPPKTPFQKPPDTSPISHCSSCLQLRTSNSVAISRIFHFAL